MARGVVDEVREAAWGVERDEVRMVGGAVWYAVRDAVEGAVWDEVWVVRGAVWVAVWDVVGNDREELFDKVKNSDG